MAALHIYVGRPAVVSWQCNAGENEEFAFDKTTGTLCTAGGVVPKGKPHQSLCLDVKPTPPNGPK